MAEKLVGPSEGGYVDRPFRSDVVIIDRFELIIGVAVAKPTSKDDVEGLLYVVGIPDLLGFLDRFICELVLFVLVLDYLEAGQLLIPLFLCVVGQQDVPVRGILLCGLRLLQQGTQQRAATAVYSRCRALDAITGAGCGFVRTSSWSESHRGWLENTDARRRRPSRRGWHAMICEDASRCHSPRRSAAST